MTQVIILGTTGMLGFNVSRFFEQEHSYKLFLSTRKPSTANEFFLDAEKPNFTALPKADYVINCIGAIKQRPYTITQFKQINSTFPFLLAEYCENNDMKLIHVTSDCVFSGKAGRYVEVDVHDATDIYGASKSSGEPKNCLNLRTSIIGHEPTTSFSFLSWAQSRSGMTAQGYINHLWNGITAREYARLCHLIIQKNLFTYGTRHIFSTTHSKHEMLYKINDMFKLNIKIEPVRHNDYVNRTLSTIYSLNSVLQPRSFDEMLTELAS